MALSNLDFLKNMMPSDQWDTFIDELNAIVSGTLPTGSVGTTELADGAVTPVKQSTAARTRAISAVLSPLPAPTGSDQLNQDRYVFTAPEAGAVVSAKLVSSAATASSDATSQYTFELYNSTQAASLSSAAVATSSAELAADTPTSITTDQNLTLASGDVLVLRTDILDDGTPNPTDLSGATLKVEIEYTI